MESKDDLVLPLLSKKGASIKEKVSGRRRDLWQDNEPADHTIFQTLGRISDEGFLGLCSFLPPLLLPQTVASQPAVHQPSPSKCLFLRAAALFSVSSHSMLSAWVIRLSFTAFTISMLMNLQPRFLF